MEPAEESTKSTLADTVRLPCALPPANQNAAGVSRTFCHCDAAAWYSWMRKNRNGSMSDSKAFRVVSPDR